MKLKTLGLLAGLTLSALPMASAFAHADVDVDLSIGLPPPPHVVVEEGPRYYPHPVYYYGYYPRHYWHARDEWREREWHDRGWHGHRWHHHHDDDD